MRRERKLWQQGNDRQQIPPHRGQHKQVTYCAKISSRMNKMEEREGKSCRRSCCFAQCTVCTDPTPTTRNKKNPKPQLFSKFSEIIQITKTALARGVKVFWSPGKRPWKNSASPTLSFCSVDHETKGEPYLLTSVTIDKTAKEKDFYSSVPTALHSKGGA